MPITNDMVMTATTRIERIEITLMRSKFLPEK
jgi:hypothetical protein